MLDLMMEAIFPVVPVIVTVYLIADRIRNSYLGDWYRTLSIIVSCIVGGSFLYTASNNEGFFLIFFTVAGLFMGLAFPVLINQTRRDEVSEE